MKLRLPIVPGVEIDGTVDPRPVPDPSSFDQETARRWRRQAITDPAVNQQVNDFVNARRAVGNQPPVMLTDTALFHELRVQRSRDFYQGGLRLGDLRRWKRDGVGDFFPTGNHVNQEWGVYGIWTCFPLPLEEYQGNPNIQPPANPLIPPGI